ncbi:MAG: type II toxin-antitoxin system HicB family antitoxin [Nitrospinota bacterium]
MIPVIFQVEVFKEDDLYVALAPDLNVSSFGETVEEAKTSLKEAVELFLEECESMGTLSEVLEEAGFVLQKGPPTRWVRRVPILIESSEVGGA